MNGLRIAGIVIGCMTLIAGAMLVGAPVPPATATTSPVIYTATRTVQFCGRSTDCRNGREYPNEVTIVPDPDPTVQIVGVWVVPSGSTATTFIDEYHAIAAPDPARPNAAVVRFLHPSSLQVSVFDYTVIVKYVKGAGAPAPR